MAAKKVKLKYIGTNLSYTAERARFDRDNPIHEVDSKLAKHLLKTGYFEEVENNSTQPSKETNETTDDSEDYENIETALD